MSSERSVKDLSGLYTKRLVGANGFEPSTSWSRTRHLNPINALFGVAYGTRSVIFPLLVVPNLYLAPWGEPLGWHKLFGHSFRRRIIMRIVTTNARHRITRFFLAGALRQSFKLAVCVETRSPVSSKNVMTDISRRARERSPADALRATRAGRLEEVHDRARRADRDWRAKSA